MSFLLDTNVVSEVRKVRGNQQVKDWLASVAGDSLYLSVLTVGQIRRGIESLRRRDPRQADIYEAWLSTLQQAYGDRLLPVTPEVADAWGRLNVPNPVPTVDGLLAATAMVHGLILVTRNTRDLAATGAQLLDPFSGSAD